jgi:hypothetical protein
MHHGAGPVLGAELHGSCGAKMRRLRMTIKVGS